MVADPARVDARFLLDDAKADRLERLVEAQWPEFLLTNIRYDAATISGTLKLETLEREPFPAGSFTPSQFPGLF